MRFVHVRSACCLFAACVAALASKNAPTDSLMDIAFFVTALAFFLQAIVHMDHITRPSRIFIGIITTVAGVMHLIGSGLHDVGLIVLAVLLIVGGALTMVGWITTKPSAA